MTQARREALKDDPASERTERIEVPFDGGGGRRSNEAASSHSASLEIGDLVADKYRVDRFMDSGGMAQIFEATNLELDERVALKLAHPTYRTRTELVERFREEARALARVRSENVARVFDVVSTDTGDPVMVMELLEGENVARISERRALPPLEEVIGWLIDACSGLAVAHANGIVHRDVKPENIFIANVLGGRRTAKMLDFGISRLAMSTPQVPASAVRVSELKLLGTPLYMAPEQILSPRAADPRIDVWGLGVVMYELLTGRVPFLGKSVEEVCERILEANPPRVSTLRPDLDPELALVVHRCLQREPSDRFPSMADLAVALLPFGPVRFATSVDQTVTVLRAAGLTTVDMPATLSLIPMLDDGTGTPRSSQKPRSMGPGPRAAGPSSAPPGTSFTPPPAPLVDTQSSALGSVAPRFGSREAEPRSRWITAAVLAALVFVTLLAVLVLRRPAAVQASGGAATVEMRLETDPAGALIEVDGAAAGTSPASTALSPGRHVLTITKPGYERLSTVVDVPALAPQTPTRFSLAPVARATQEPTSSATEARSAAPATTNAPSRVAGPAPTPDAKPAATAPIAKPVTPDPKATVKVIDDKPSTTRVIQ